MKVNVAASHHYAKAFVKTRILDHARRQLQQMQGNLGKALLRANAASLAVRILAITASTCSSVVLARVLGPDDYGLYAFILALITLLIFPAQLGIPTLIVRETARSGVLADWGSMKGIWIWATAIISAGSLAVIGVTVLANNILSSALSVERSSALWAAIPLIFVLAMARVPAAALRGLRRVFLGQLSDRVIRPALLALFVAVGATMTSQGVSAPETFVLHTIAGSIALAISIIVLKTSRPKPLTGRCKPTYHTSTWLRAVVPLTIIVGLQLIHENTDLLMLGLMASDAEVAFYKVSVSLATLVAFGLTAINMAVQPYIAEFHSRQRLDRLQKLVSASALAAIFLSTPIIIMFILFGEHILALVFGEEYRTAHRSLMILSAGQAANAYFGVVGALLVMTGNEKENLKALAASLVLNVSLNALLIPAHGAEGAAVATAASMLVWNILYWRSASRILDVSSTPLGLIRHRKKNSDL